MQSCFQPKFLVLLRKLQGVLNDKKETNIATQPTMEFSLIRRLRPPAPEDEPLAASVNGIESHEEAYNDDLMTTMGTSQIDCRFANINVDGDFLSYIPCEGSDAVGLWISGTKLTPNASYFEVEITDCGLEGNMCIGLCSWKHPLNTHVGSAAGSIGLSTESGRLFKDGDSGSETVHMTGCEYDRIGCGIRFELLPDQYDIEDMIPVYFVRNGKEVCSIWMVQPPGGLHPAVSMRSFGEEVRVSLGLSKFSCIEDDEMVVDSNEDDWSRLYEVQQRGQVLEYSGKGKSIADVGLAQARYPLNTTVHYFEVEIVDPGENCCIAIGLTRKDYPEHRHPGWDKGSIGYHADDGQIFVGSGRGHPFGPRCHKGDRMGCGIYFPPDYACRYDSDCEERDVSPSSEHQVELVDLTGDTSESEDEDWWAHQAKVDVFFTRNGKTIGMRQVRIPRGGFYPSIGMMGINEKVRVDLRPLTG